jgi:hydrogenase maturation protein HypF
LNIFGISSQKYSLGYNPLIKECRWGAVEEGLKRIQITIFGRVQGVGFRPFIFRLAQEHHLLGSIKNTCTGVFIDAEGDPASLEAFQQDILQKKPAPAVIEKVIVSPAQIARFTCFEIAKSSADSDKFLPLMPDTAMCKECLGELLDPKNRRYLYPFLHCISCGPRFSLFLGTPFDRQNTTMKEFPMCAACKEEYENPKDRRFHSQTTCCPACGPKLKLVDVQGNEIAHPLETAVRALHEGKIIAMKNTGGYLLLADATNESAVQLLRKRKRRVSKPFALLLPNMAWVERIAHVTEIERQVLVSATAPIVLLRKKETEEIANSVASASPDFGVMLPHNGLQYLLMGSFAKPLIATSGNVSGKPLCITEEAVFDELSQIADLFLIHNRKIIHRLDDSIVRVIADQPVVMRKARGYIPYAVQAPLKDSLFGAGSHMKNSFAFLKNDRIYMGQHMGDLDSVDACIAYDSEVKSWSELLGCQNMRGVGDKHPEYYTTGYLERKFRHEHEGVQHHKAHIYAVMADAKISPPFLGIAWDGTGWGDDGTVWGGESFLVTEQEMERFSSLYPFALPGGEKAVEEPRRSMLGLIGETHACQAFTSEELAVLRVALQKKINTPICSSMGRLFDAVSAILDLCLVADFEGQAAILLEKAAYEAKTEGSSYSLPLVQEKGLLLLDWHLMIEEILEDKARGVSVSEIALNFHETLAIGIVHVAQEAGMEKVLLTGGVMQNKLLVEKAVTKLKAAGFIPYLHRDVPPNDGGIAVGQLMAVSITGKTRRF